MRLADDENRVTRRFRKLVRNELRPVAALVMTVLLSSLATRAQPAQPSEYQLKAAFIYHFAQLVTWPTSAFPQTNSPIVIGVLGANPFGKHLEASVRGKNISGHPLAVLEFQTVAAATNACHILFISSSENRRLQEVFAVLEGTNLLTVGETERFWEAGGIINFVLEGSKIRFQINDAAAKNAGLKISSKLLSLASKKAT